MTSVTLNKEQRLYVLDHGNHISCLGFDVAFNKLKSLHEELSKILLPTLNENPACKGAMRVCKTDSDNGKSCIDFEVTVTTLNSADEALNKMLSKPLPEMPKYKGTMKVYKTLQKLQNIAMKIHNAYGIKMQCGLTKQLIGLEGKRVEVVDCYNEKRRFKVGRSTGWIPCHIELANERSSGGMAVMGAPFKSVRVIR